MCIMINMEIDEYTLMDLFKKRVEEFCDGDDLILEGLYHLLADGVFDGMQLDVNAIVDNFYINDTIVLTKEEAEENDLHLEDAIASNHEENRYLFWAF